MGFLIKRILGDLKGSLNGGRKRAIAGAQIKAVQGAINHIEQMVATGIIFIKANSSFKRNGEVIIKIGGGIMLFAPNQGHTELAFNFRRIGIDVDNGAARITLGLWQIEFAVKPVKGLTNLPIEIDLTLRGLCGPKRISFLAISFR